MTTFAQNIANAGFAWKILRIKDLMSKGWVALVLLVERLCIIPKWSFEISQ